MAPVKFDDLHKTSNEVLSDDFQSSGFQFKAKQKTSFDGAVITTATDLFGKDDCKTPSKLTWKFPTPLGTTKLAIDKLEMDKGGKFKLEASTNEVHKDLKLECKSDLMTMASLVACCTYTGLADTQIKLETKAVKPEDFTAEMTRVVPGGATVGVKCVGGVAGLKAPSVGVRYLSGNYFCSLYAKEKLSVFTASCYYKAAPMLKVAATYEKGGKKDGSFGVACAYEVNASTSVKAKVSDDMSFQCALKHNLCKGFTVLPGCKLDASGLKSYGLQVSIE